MSALPPLGLVLLALLTEGTQSPTLHERMSRLNQDMNIGLGIEAVSPPLQDLVREATLVVLGRVEPPTSYLSADGTTIYSDYPLEVNRVIAGVIRPSIAIRPGSTANSIPVTVIGGTLEIGGHRVRVINEGLPELPSREEVMLLLKEPHPGKYELVSPVFGAYVVRDGKVMSLSKRPGSHREFDGRPVEELVRAVSAAAARP